MQSSTPKKAISGPGITRRRLILGGIGGAGAAATGLSPAGRSASAKPEEITFAFGPDDSGSQKALIDAFNQEYSGRIHVRYQRMARASDAFYREMVSGFDVNSTRVDVFGGDIVWTAAFASRGYVSDLTGRFNNAFDRSQFLDAPLASAGYRNRIWGVPWFTAAGMLYYRKDLLEAAGYNKPPATWQELGEMARKVKSGGGPRYGFVFQGDEYEGGVTNALEYLWSAGGRVLTGNLSTAAAFGMSVSQPNVIVIDSDNSARGMQIAHRLVANDIAPAKVAEFREKQSTQAFLDGDAVFLRCWPYVYGLLDSPRSSLRADQVGIAPIPTIAGRERSYSCLGGWNLMINARSSKQAAAWEFIRFATAAERQKQRAREGGFLPTRAALYDDKKLVSEVPVMQRGRAALDNARLRPVTPYYESMSQRLAIVFNRVLRGEVSGRQAVSRLQRELQLILDKRG